MLSQLRARLRRLSRRGKIALALIGVAALAGCGALALFLFSQTQSNSGAAIRRWFSDPDSRDDHSTPRAPCRARPSCCRPKG